MIIEKVILDYLSEQLKIPVYMEEPIKPPKSYVLIEKTGSSEENYISKATIAIQSYANSLYDSATLNAKVKLAMFDVNLPQITKCKLNTDYNFTDTSTKRYRYQAIFDITFYEE